MLTSAETGSTVSKQSQILWQECEDYSRLLTILFSAMTYSRYERQHTCYHTSNSTAQNKTSWHWPEDNQTLFTHSHLYHLSSFDCISSWHYQHHVLLQFFMLYALFDSIQVSSRKIIHLSIQIEPPELQLDVDSAESELAACWPHKTAKKEATLPSNSSLDAAKGANDTGTSEKRKCNCGLSLSVLTPKLWVHSRCLQCKQSLLLDQQAWPEDGHSSCWYARYDTSLGTHCDNLRHH